MIKTYTQSEVESIESIYGVVYHTYERNLNERFINESWHRAIASENKDLFMYRNINHNKKIGKQVVTSQQRNKT